MYVHCTDIEYKYSSIVQLFTSLSARDDTPTKTHKVVKVVSGVTHFTRAN